MKIWFKSEETSCNCLDSHSKLYLFWMCKASRFLGHSESFPMKRNTHSSTKTLPITAETLRCPCVSPGRNPNLSSPKATKLWSILSVLLTIQSVWEKINEKTAEVASTQRTSFVPTPLLLMLLHLLQKLNSDSSVLCTSCWVPGKEEGVGPQEFIFMWFNNFKSCVGNKDPKRDPSSLKSQPVLFKICPLLLFSRHSHGGVH